jgi:hypothetical protein
MINVNESPNEIFQTGSRGPVFFSHIPKTAGTSLRSFLQNQYHPSEICPAQDWQGLKDLPPEDLKRYQLLHGHLFLNAQELAPPGARSIVVLRDPIARTVSAIQHMQRDPSFHHMHDAVKGKSISEILQDENLRVWFANTQASYLCSRHPAAAVLQYLRGGQSRWNIPGLPPNPADLEDPPELEFAKEQLGKVDFVGVVDQIDELIRVISTEMNFHPAVVFPHVNESPSRDDGRPGGLTEAEMALLRACNDLDLPLYEYARSLAQQRAALVAPRTVAQSVRELCDAGVYRAMANSFELDLRALIPGWYSPETDKDSVWRWTGPFPTFTLELPIVPDADYVCSLTVWSAVSEVTTENFLVNVNGYHQEVTVEPDRGLYRVVIPISRSVLFENDGVCELRFELPGVFRPSDAGSSDIRKLGIMVKSVRFQRIGA